MKKIFLLAGLILIVLFFVGFVIVNQKNVISKPLNKNVDLPQIAESLKVTKLIKAKEGGEISVKDTKGVEITLSIPADSLNKDETVELTPTVGIDSGVEIKPLNLVLAIPGSVTFNYHPTAAPSLIPMGQVQGEQDVNINELLQQVDIPEIKQLMPAPTPTPQAEAKKPEKGNSGVLYIDATGETHVWPSYVSGEGNVATTVAGGGYYSAGTIDTSKGDSLAGAAAKNLDKSCRGQAWEDFVNALVYANQNYDAAWWYSAKGAANKCMDERIAEISAKCANDKISVRRRDIQALEYLAAGLRLDGKLATLKGLENSCIAKYEIKDEKTKEGVGVGNTLGTITHKIEASVCGFLDDEWQGNDSTVGCATGSPSCQDWATNFKMRFPANGGQATFSEVKGQMSTRPIVLTFAVNVPLATVTLVTKDMVDIKGGLGLVRFSTTILKTSDSCTPEPGLEPMNPYNPNK